MGAGAIDEALRRESRARAFGDGIPGSIALAARWYFRYHRETLA